MKFDYVIGNPPYQDETLGDNGTYAPPVYNLFMDETYKVADKVELIHPARFCSMRALHQSMESENVRGYAFQSPVL